MGSVRFEPADGISGSLRPPPDKSISHRAALVAAMSEGTATVRNYLRAADTQSTLAAIETLGARVERGDGEAAGLDLAIEGIGLRGALESQAAIDVGNAGTLLRILPGWLAGQGRGAWTLDGDDSIRRRPVDRVAAPLREMGAAIEARDGRLPPVRVTGSALHGIRYELPVASAQVKSCVLLAALLAQGGTTVVEPVASRDHTERMLAQAGAAIVVERAERAGPGSVTVHGAERLGLGMVAVPGDFSSAAFFLVAATIVPGSEIVLEGVGTNPTRTGLLAVMERMGAQLQTLDERVLHGEPVATLAVRDAGLRGTSVQLSEVPLVIDELPLVALLGVFAHGTTVVTGAEELRHKESDRISTVVAGLRGLGAQIEATADGFVVEGQGGLEGGRIDSHGDHRLAMLGAVAGIASGRGVEVSGFEAASVSYPGFAADLEQVLGRSM